MGRVFIRGHIDRQTKAPRGHWLFRRPLPDVDDWLAVAFGMLFAFVVLLAWAAVR